MRALVVYESMFGNTKRIALAVAEGMSQHLAVEAVEVSLAPLAIADEIEFLVVGGPTHVHGMTSGFTRTQAAKQATAPLVSDRLGMREWLEESQPSQRSTKAAAFDTRIKGAEILTGSAAHGYEKRLRTAGYTVVAEPESFFIATKAPQDDALLPGEIERARAWGAELALRIVGRVATPIA
jgi:hypothetical protein